MPLLRADRWLSLRNRRSPWLRSLPHDGPQPPLIYLHRFSRPPRLRFVLLLSLLPSRPRPGNFFAPDLRAPQPLASDAVPVHCARLLQRGDRLFLLHWSRGRSFLPPTARGLWLPVRFANRRNPGSPLRASDSAIRIDAFP